MPSIRVGPNQGGKKIRVKYRGFIGQNTQTPGGSSKINPWIFNAKSEKPPVLEKNPDKPPVLRKFRSPVVDPNFFYPWF